MHIQKPNYTQIPNVLLDELMSEMRPGEFMVTMVIARKTIGWHKRSDTISLSQFEELTGLSRQGVINSINDGIERGTIIKTTTPGKSNTYQLNIDYSDEEPDPLVKNFDPQQSRNLTNTPTKVVKKVDTQKKGIKEKERKDATNDLKEKYAIIDQLGLMPHADDVRADVRDYSLEIWQEASQIFEARRRDNPRLNYRFFQGIMRNIQQDMELEQQKKTEFSAAADDRFNRMMADIEAEELRITQLRNQMKEDHDEHQL